MKPGLIGCQLNGGGRRKRRSLVAKRSMGIGKKRGGGLTRTGSKGFCALPKKFVCDHAKSQSYLWFLHVSVIFNEDEKSYPKTPGAAVG